MGESASGLSAILSRRRLRPGFFRFSAVELLIAIILLFVATPLLQDFPGGDFIEAILMSLVLILGVLAVSGRRRMSFWATLLVLPAIVGKWLNHLRPDLCPRPVFIAAALIFIGFVVINLLRYILRTPQVSSEVLCASIAAYLLLGIMWAFAYVLTTELRPDAFSFSTPGQTLDGPTSFYFSFVTLSTVGYGDIVPVAPVARMLAIMESMTGLFYVAVLVARLVALYSVPSPSNPSDPTPP